MDKGNWSCINTKSLPAGSGQVNEDRYFIREGGRAVRGENIRYAYGKGGILNNSMQIFTIFKYS